MPIGVNLLPTPHFKTTPKGSTATSYSINQTTYLFPYKKPGFNDPRGIAGFEFDWSGEVKYAGRTESTDHYAEDNSTINDHIGLPPRRVTMRGYVAEVSQSKAEAEGLFGGLQNALTRVPAYTQGLGGVSKYTAGATAAIGKAVAQANRVANQLNQAIAQGRNIVKLLPSSPTPTEQQLAFAEIDSLRASRQIFAVVTPWNIFTSMIIESLDASQPEDTEDWTEFGVTMKEFRTVKVGLSAGFLSTNAERNLWQQGLTTNNGESPNVTKRPGFLYDYAGFK